MIELRQLNKTYDLLPYPLQVLKNISLRVEKGEIFGLLGKSGAGKSTLLRCVNLLEKPDSGSIRVNDVELTTLSLKQLRIQRRKISMIFQHFNLLASRNVFDNVALPLEIVATPSAVIQTKIMQLLDIVGLTERKDFYPAQLSGGQKQRVAIARALATDPYVLLSDEATSALDPESTQDILKLLKAINQEFGLTILLITHQLSLVKQICDRVGIIDAGTLIEQNDVVNILAHPQMPITRQFVQNALHLGNIIPIVPIAKPLHPNEKFMVLQLTFTGENCDIPLISNLIKKFSVTVNIRQAQIESVKNTMLGFTICELMGSQDTLREALQYIQSTPVQVEVLHHA